MLNQLLPFSRCLGAGEAETSGHLAADAGRALQQQDGAIFQGLRCCRSSGHVFLTHYLYSVWRISCEHFALALLSSKGQKLSPAPDKGCYRNVLFGHTARFYRARCTARLQPDFRNTDTDLNSALSSLGTHRAEGLGLGSSMVMGSNDCIQTQACSRAWGSVKQLHHVQYEYDSQG